MVTSLLDYDVSVAVIQSNVLQKSALWALACLLWVKSLPVLKAGPRSARHFSLTSP